MSIILSKNTDLKQNRKMLIAEVKINLFSMQEVLKLIARLETGTPTKQIIKELKEKLKTPNEKLHHKN